MSVRGRLGRRVVQMQSGVIVCAVVGMACSLWTGKWGAAVWAFVALLQAINLIRYPGAQDRGY